MLTHTATRAFFLFLAVLLVLNLFMAPAHPHFAAETLPWFWAGFGLIGGYALVIAGGGILAPLLRKKEEGGDDR
ncbi:MAG: hypothetical protein HY795_18860 [Desulfovibrio sp.]|nr:hypothetical protein [Desulfovibrio sp.]MBI4960931.1 hypothetical protein [Desulfovibrio sp.]